MSRNRFLLICTTLPALALACATSSTFRLQADVRTLHAGSHNAADITAVGGADVALQCPDAAASRPLGKTDDSGALHVEGDGAIPLACKLAITEPGYKPVALAVADICTEKSMGACAFIELRAMLAPEAH